MNSVIESMQRGCRSDKFVIRNSLCTPQVADADAVASIAGAATNPGSSSSPQPPLLRILPSGLNPATTGGTENARGEPVVVILFDNQQDVVSLLRNALERIDANSSNWLSSEATGWHRMVSTCTEASAADKRPPPSAAKLRVNRISAIQATFGLPMQTLARILWISRPCLYRWLDATKELTLQAVNRQRLSFIESVADQWRTRSAAPLNSVAHEPLTTGQTVVQLLTSEDVNEEAIAAAIDELAGKLAERPKSLSQRVSEAGFKRRPSQRPVPDDE